MRSYTCHLSRSAFSNSFGLSAAKKRQTDALDVSPLTARVYDPSDGASEEAIARPRQQRTRATTVPRLRRQVPCVPSRHQCERRECGEKAKLKNKSVRKNRGRVYRYGPDGTRKAAFPAAGPAEGWTAAATRSGRSARSSRRCRRRRPRGPRMPSLVPGDRGDRGASVTAAIGTSLCVHICFVDD